MNDKERYFQNGVLFMYIFEDLIYSENKSTAKDIHDYFVFHRSNSRRIADSDIHAIIEIWFFPDSFLVFGQKSIRIAIHRNSSCFSKKQVYHCCMSQLLYCSLSWSRILQHYAPEIKPYTRIHSIIWKKYELYFFILSLWSQSRLI